MESPFKQRLQFTRRVRQTQSVSSRTIAPSSAISLRIASQQKHLFLSFFGSILLTQHATKSPPLAQRVGTTFKRNKNPKNTD